MGARHEGDVCHDKWIINVTQTQISLNGIVLHFLKYNVEWWSEVEIKQISFGLCTQAHIHWYIPTLINKVYIHIFSNETYFT